MHTHQPRRRFRAFTIVDDFNREALHIEVDYSLTSKRVVYVLNHLINHRGKPDRIRMDNGSEFITKIAAEWAKLHEIEFKYTQPGKPTQNTYIERFNGTYRRGVLNRYIVDNLDQVRETTQIWMDDYNHHRAHDALGNLPPIEYAKKNLNKASLVEIDHIKDNIVLTNSSN